MIFRWFRRRHVWEADADGCCYRCRHCPARTEDPKTDKTYCKGF